MEPDSTAAPGKSPPQGIGGWLLALAILQCFFLFVEGIGLLKYGWEFIVGWQGVPQSVARLVRGGQFIMHGALLGFAIYATFLLSERRAHFVKIFSVQLALFAFLPLGEIVLLVVITALDGWPGFPWQLSVKFIIHVLIAVGLYRYLESSVRVRNTFVR
ncbi:MAG: DUF2569 family protein [Rhodospirillales bacterium]|nr:DUF2569 family protein [Rhodospirillales bacterium]